ncbi:MAG: DUF4403 family protein [Bacteroidetes bacterium]|nr:DUF4403 family protein [Bacteroidota bacterium]
MHLLISLLPLVFLVGCNGWEVKAPEPTQAGQPTITAPVSFVHLPVSVGTSLIESEVVKNFGNSPVFKGNTGEISAKLLVDKSFPDILEDVLVTPYKAAGCVTKQVASTCIKNVTKDIWENCLKRLRLDRCLKRVVVPVQYQCMKEVQECWPEVKEVVESRIKVHAYVKEQLLPTSVVVNYEGWLRGIDIDAQGQNIAVRLGLHTEVWVDVKQGVLDASVKIKGALKCKADFGVFANVHTSVNSDASIALTVQDFKLDVKRLCLPGVVELADVGFLDPTKYIQKEIFLKLIEKPLLKFVNKQIHKSIGDDLVFGEQISEMSKKLNEPIEAGGDVWITVNPSKMLVTQLVGSGSGGDNKLKIGFGLEAYPNISLGDPPAPEPLKEEIKFEVVDHIGAGIHLLAKGSLQVSYAQDRLKSDLITHINEKHGEFPLSVGDVELYQSGDKFVIGLSIVKRGNDKLQGKLFLWATPYLDVESAELRLREVGFDVETKNILADVGAWLLTGEIEKVIEDKARFKYGGELSRLQSDFAEIELDSDIGSLFGKIDSISAEQIWVGDSAINLIAKASGSAAFELKPKLQ